MLTINLRASAMKWVITCCATIAFLAQSPQPLFPQGRLSVDYPEDSRPPLAFREDWQDDWNDGEPLARLNDYHDTDLDAHLQNRGLRHAWYGPGAGAPDIRSAYPHSDSEHAAEHREGWEYIRHIAPKDDPGYLWAGQCGGPCAITLRDNDNDFDMTGLAKVRWRTKMDGFRQIRLILKLADGTFLVSDRYAGPTGDWNVSEISIPDVRWHSLNIETLNEGRAVANPDLGRVEEIGFTHQRTGAARVDWIELYAASVQR